jgi:hypothetical protein
MWLSCSVNQGLKNKMSQTCTFLSKVYTKLRIPSLPLLIFSFFYHFFSCFPCQLISELHDLLQLQSKFNIWNIGSSHHSQFNINQMLLVNLYITVNSKSFWDWHDNHWFKTSLIFMKNNLILTPSVSFWAWFPLLAARAAANSSACLINITRISNLYVNSREKWPNLPTASIRKLHKLFFSMALIEKHKCKSQPLVWDRSGRS